MDYFLGDSMTLNPPQLVPFYPWVFEALAERAPPSVKAVPGSCACDVADQAFPLALTGEDRAFVMLGTNDRMWYGASRLALFDTVLRAIGLQLTRHVVTARNSAWRYTGAWSDLDLFGASQNKRTSENGASATIDFTGDSFDLCHCLVDGYTSNFYLYVDGAPTPDNHIQCSSAGAIASKRGRLYAPSVVHRSGFGPGPHTLAIAVSALPGSYVNLCWLAGASNGSQLKFLSAPRSLLTVDSDALAAAYNAQLAATAAAIGADFIDTASVVDPATDLVTGEAHMHTGHYNVARYLKSVL